MKTSVAIEKILELLQAHAEATVDLLDAMTSGRESSRRKLRHLLYHGGTQFHVDWAVAYRDRQKFYNLLNNLRRQGLVLNKKEGRHSIWKITQQGLKKLDIARTRILYSKRAAHYDKSGPSATFKIVAYDVPANEGHKKTRWLREALINLGFTMLQKSVWTGKKNIPEQFLRDLHERHMTAYVHIFEVTKSGTLEGIA